MFGRFYVKVSDYFLNQKGSAFCLFPKHYFILLVEGSPFFESNTTLGRLLVPFFNHVSFVWDVGIFPTLAGT